MRRGRIACWLSLVVFAFGWESRAENPRAYTAVMLPPEVRDEAAQFAIPLLQLADQIRMQYYRPVKQADLLVAAFQGLYESANRSAPEALRIQFENRTDMELVVTVARLRAELGACEAIAGRKALLACAQTINRALDPHCGPVGSREYGAVSEEPYFGLGMSFVNVPVPESELGQELRQQFGPRRPPQRSVDTSRLPAELLVKLVLPGSPAQQLGIRPGDRIMAIDRRPCDQCNLSYFREVFFPDASERAAPSHQFEIARAGQSTPIQVSATAAEFWPESVFGYWRTGDAWDFMIDRKDRVGYLRLYAIDKAAPASFRQALESLQRNDARGLILDLRWCPGGFLDYVAEIAESLLPKDQSVASVLRVSGLPMPITAPRAGEPITQLPIVVLVGGDTIGGGELIAAALQDHRRAVVAGTRTFGKRSVQQPLRPNPLDHLFPESKFKISTGALLRPAEVQRAQSNELPPAVQPEARLQALMVRYNAMLANNDWSVQPDAGRWLPISRELSQQLREWWMLHALRPANDRTPLPIDDPDADPQLRAAILMLKDLIK